MGRQGIANYLWAVARLGLDPGPAASAALARRAAAIAGEFNPQVPDGPDRRLTPVLGPLFWAV